MESFDFSKIIWGVAIAAYLFLQVRGRKVKGGESQPQEEDGAQEGSLTPEELERIFGQEESRLSEESISKDQPLRGRVASKAKVPTINFNDTTSLDQPKVEERKKVDFDLKKAVIMSEILTPKFKNQ